MEQPNRGQLGIRARPQFRVHYLVLAYYTILSILMTYPWILHATTMFPGDGGDGYLYVWHFWFFKKRVLHLQNPFFTDDIFYPIGTSLLFTSYTLVNDVLALALSVFTRNLVVISNILFLLAFVLSGYCAFLLADYLTHNRWAALLSGTIFAFCPYHFAHSLGHFDLTLTHWIPLFILFFLKMADPKGTYGQAIITGVIAVLTMVDASYYYTVFLIFFVALFYIYNFLAHEHRWEYFGWRGVQKALALVSTALVLASPVFALAYKHAKAGYYQKVEGWLGANDYVADLTAFLLPTPSHPLWKSLHEYYTKTLANVEGVVFIGWLVTILVLFASLHLARQRSELRMWRFLFMAFMILSLGPTLHVKGKYLFEFDGLSISIPLPFFLVHFVPILGHLRSPGRFNVMAMLCAAVLSAYAWVWIQERIQHKRKLALCFSSIILIILGEYLSVPYPACTAKVPEVFQKIAKDKSSGTVLEIPFAICDGTFGRGHGGFQACYWAYAQIIHNKKRIAGYTSRGAKVAADYYERFPVIHKLLDLEEIQEKRISPPPKQDVAQSAMEIQADDDRIKQIEEEAEGDRQTIPDLIAHSSLRYIVIHPQHRDKFSHQYLVKVFSLRDSVYQDSEGYLLYEIEGSHKHSNP